MKTANFVVGTRVIRARDRAKWLRNPNANLASFEFGIVQKIDYAFGQKCSLVRWDNGSEQLVDNRDLRRS